MPLRLLGRAKIATKDVPPAQETRELAEIARLRAQLKDTRKRLRRQRERRTRAETALESRDKSLRAARAELAILRDFSLSLFRDVELPDPVRDVISEVRSERLTYLDRGPLESLVRCMLEVEASGREGVIIEAGTAMGGSAIAIAAAKNPQRPMFVYDVFGMIPPPSGRDGEDVIARYDSIAEGKSKGLKGDVYYGYREDLKAEVEASFARHGVAVGDHCVSLVQGLFEDVITGDEPVALAHVDGDWYDSTMTCLERIAPRLVPGGRIVIDDYYVWSGCRDAVNDFTAANQQFRVEMRAKVHIVRPPS